LLVPDAPPENVTATAKSSTEINVLWDPPPVDKQNGIITKYKVSYWKTVSQSVTVKYVTGTSTPLDNLEMYTFYTINVQAYTSAGGGNISSNIMTRTMEGRKYNNIFSIQFGKVKHHQFIDSRIHYYDEYNAQVQYMS